VITAGSRHLLTCETPIGGSILSQTLNMDGKLPKLSICIPAYNRARYLSPLLDSVLSQNYQEIEIVISEDDSPEREQIAAVVGEYRQRGVDCIRYFSNKQTLGFDGNLRILFERATGDYCVMMGNDDLLCPGALHTIGTLLADHPEVAVAIRSYGWFYSDPTALDQVVHYFPDNRIFAPGESTAVTFFRRVGVLAGLVFRRSDAIAAASDRFDGSLYYQVYLAAELLLKGHGLYMAETIAICRENKPDFGQSQSEKGKFQPGTYTSDARISMIQALLEIASFMDEKHHGNIRQRVLKDLGNYSYYFLAYQASSPLSDFWRYYRTLGAMGFNGNGLFHLYFAGLALLGRANCERLIKFLRTKLKSTPRLGNLEAGSSLTELRKPEPSSS
jgi:glycosyltransferase involved in cell wall biosynthesis